MENNQDAQYDFCPRCGALARDGVCTSCGYQNPAAVQEKMAVGTEEAEIVVKEAEAVADVKEAAVSVANETETKDVVKEEAEVVDAPGKTEASSENSYTFSEQNPYAEYVNRTAYSNGAIPPDVPQKNGNGKVWAVVIICVAIFVLLFVLLGCAVNNLISNVKKLPQKVNSEYQDRDHNLPEEDSEDSGDAYNSDDQYYEFGNALRDDLPYSATFKEKEYEEKDRDVYIYCSYPFLEGDIPNIDYLNQLIYEEYLYFLDYYKDNVREDMREDESYQCVIDSYVTYMDEEKISVVFSENAEWDDYFILSLYCINIDVENGVVLDNTAILDIDDEFSVDFRIREEKQNQSNALDWYTDQELTEMMNDPIDLIIFYTPLGMEVGVNHDNGWCTVTYKDYEEYLKHF